MSSPSSTDHKTGRRLTRRAALASGSLLFAGSAGCISRAQEQLDPRTYHNDAILGESAAPWPTLAQNSNRTGHRATPTTLSEEPTVTRVAPSSGFVHTPPALAGKTVFAAVHTNDQSPIENGFVAADIDSGHRWFDQREKAPATPTVVGETVFLTSAGVTRAVNRERGELHWEYPVGTGHSAPTVVGEIVYVGSKHLVALDAITGERKWRSSDIPKWPGRTAATPQTVFAASGSQLSALEPADGAVRWTAPLAVGTYDTPVVDEEVIVVTESDSTLRCINRSDGTVRWSASLDKHSQTAPAIADGRLYMIDDSNDMLRSFDAISGDEHWQTNLGPIVSHRPAIGDNSLFVQYTGESGDVAVVNAKTGEIQRIITIPVGVASSFALADDGVFFVGEENSGEYGVYLLS